MLLFLLTFNQFSRVYAINSVRIVFFISKKSNFTWIEIFEDVENIELKKFIIEYRNVLFLLEVKRTARQKPLIDFNSNNYFKDYCISLLRKARTIEKDEILNKKDERFLIEIEIFLAALKYNYIDFF